MSLLIVLLCLIFFGGFLFLVTQNGTPVDIEVLLSKYHQVPLSIVMTICLLGGIGFAALVSFLDGARLRLQNQRLRRQIGRLEVEIQQLHRIERPERSTEAAIPSAPRDFPYP